MKAIVIIPGKTGAQFAERPEPNITRPDEIKVRVRKGRHLPMGVHRQAEEND